MGLLMPAAHIGYRGHELTNNALSCDDRCGLSHFIIKCVGCVLCGAQAEQEQLHIVTDRRVHLNQPQSPKVKGKVKACIACTEGQFEPMQNGYNLAFSFFG